MPVRNIVFCACIAAGALLTPAVVLAEDIYIDEAPPAPHTEVIPESRAGYTWSPGYWAWENDRHVWVEGHWVEERPHAHWVPDHWEKQDPHWHFVAGHWDQQ